MVSSRRRFLTALGSGVALGASGCLGLASGGDFDVGMRAVAFAPAEFETTVGETVVWHNTSSRTHTVTAYDSGVPDGAEYFASGGYDSEQVARDAWQDTLGGAITSGDSYSHTFEVPGTYAYVCIPHEQGGMTGVVKVREK